MINPTAFVRELLDGLAASGRFQRMDLATEGPVAEGRAYLREDLFLRFYFNEKTSTVAFALVKDGWRVWGIDRDNRRGWHMHPLENPESHVAIAPVEVSEILAQLMDALKTLQE